MVFYFSVEWKPTEMDNPPDFPITLNVEDFILLHAFPNSGPMNNLSRFTQTFNFHNKERTISKTSVNSFNTKCVWMETLQSFAHNMRKERLWSYHCAYSATTVKHNVYRPTSYNSCGDDPNTLRFHSMNSLVIISLSEII